MLPNFFLVTSITTIITGLLYVPFINLLYKLKFDKRSGERKDIFGKKTPIYNKLREGKTGTPTGGGILVVLLIAILFPFLSWKFGLDTNRTLMIFATFVCIGLLGLLDDLRKIFKFKTWGLSASKKFIIQFIVSFVVSYLGVLMGIIKFSVGTFVITNFWALVGISIFFIIFMTNAVNITDGVDGLVAGLLLFSLIVIGIIMGYSGLSAELLFASMLFGALLAYLYFNITPARVFMGDTGALAFGAIIALLALMGDFGYLLPIFGGVFIIEGLSTLIQWTSKWLRNGKKVFLIAPIHHHFEALGWSEQKVTFRFWIAGIFLSTLALGIYFFLV